MSEEQQKEAPATMSQLGELAKNNIELMQNFEKIAKAAASQPGLSKDDRDTILRETAAVREEVKKDIHSLNDSMLDLYAAQLEDTIDSTQSAINELQNKDEKTPEDINEIYRLEVVKENIVSAINQEMTYLHFASNVPANIDELFAIPNAERKFEAFMRYCRSRDIKIPSLKVFFKKLREMDNKTRGSQEGRLVHLYALMDMFEKMTEEQRVYYILFFRISIEMFTMCFAKNVMSEGMNNFMVRSAITILNEKDKNRSSVK